MAQRPLCNLHTDLLIPAVCRAGMAPVGFLAWGSILSWVFQEQDWVFRVIPFVSSCVAIPLLFILARKATDSVTALLAAALLALSPAQVSLASVAKPYPSDVAVCAALMFGAFVILSDQVKGGRDLFIYGGVGGALLLFSFPAVLVAFALAALLAARWIGERGWSAWQPIAALGVPLGSGP